MLSVPTPLTAFIHLVVREQESRAARIDALAPDRTQCLGDEGARRLAAMPPAPDAAQAVEDRLRPLRQQATLADKLDALRASGLVPTRAQQDSAARCRVDRASTERSMRHNASPNSSSSDAGALL